MSLAEMSPSMNAHATAVSPRAAHFGDPLALLIGVSEAIATHRDLTSLFRDLARRLPAVVPFEQIALFLHDAAKNLMRVHVLGTADDDRVAPGLELPVDGSPLGLAFTHQQATIVGNPEEVERFPWCVDLMRETGVESVCIVPLTTSVRPLGAMGFGSSVRGAFERSDLDFLRLVARQVAVAVDNVLHEEDARVAQQQLSRERDRLRLLWDVNHVFVSRPGLEQLLTSVSACLHRLFSNQVRILLFEPELRRYGQPVENFAKDGTLIHDFQSHHDRTESPAGLAIATRRVVLWAEPDLERLRAGSHAVTPLTAGVKSVCSVPLLARDRVLGALNISSERSQAFTPDDVEVLQQVAQQTALAIEKALAHRQVEDLKQQSAERLYLTDDVRAPHDLEEIVGKSPALTSVLQQVQIVAPTDSTVLIEGETGTGKELIARAIHRLSGRKSRPFVKLNCAAIPTGLLESELFGHEKGAFTGAIAQRIGRFELAHRGTLFLDEVGDIPVELQPKLLRVIQEQEFERLGSTRTIRVDVRLVAATNRDLAAMVSDSRFRSDLYYRLHVFPIGVPPLRERREDIPALVAHFMQGFSKRLNKRIISIATETMAALCRYAWPGNIRELENFIERAVVLTRGPELEAPLAELRRRAGPIESDGLPPLTTLEDAEREHIRRALEEANWQVGGPSGAAARLGMKRTTLQGKMVKLGIARPRPWATRLRSV